jgi:restriction system protein
MRRRRWRTAFALFAVVAAVILELPLWVLGSIVVAALVAFILINVLGPRSERELSDLRWAKAHAMDRWSLELLKCLEWRRFEEICAAYFETLGFVAKATRFGADGGVDIELFAAGARSPSIIVQCKAWNTYTVGVKPVRELLGVMAARRISEGIFVTSGQFTKEARDFARGQNIQLFDGEELISKIQSLAPGKSAALLSAATKGDFLTPTCPSCGTKMTERTNSRDGTGFWGCVNYPRCRQTFKLKRAF